MKPVLFLISCALAVNCAAQTTYDARILDYTGLRYACEGEGLPVLKIQNAGSATMGTCVVETWKNGLMVNSFDWILAVPALQGEVRQPALPSVPVDPGDQLEFHIISVNGEPDEDTDGNILTVPMDIVPGSATTYLVNVVVNMSTPPDSLFWSITDSDAQAVAQGGPYTTDGLEELWVELQPDACYMLRLAEAGSAPSGDGQLAVFSDDAVVVDLIGGTDAAPSRGGLVTGLSLGAAAPSMEPLFAWPNPASEFLRISRSTGAVRVTLRDVQGRIVKEVVAASGVAIDVADLSPGLYGVEAHDHFGAVLNTRLMVAR
ncbi:MAG: T9SS type A sorting domain-containing protein [Flavobacteriales bacterium]|nr:T9SS type A sorting domain-containing protein [Flavobacteriales bacterium]